jgi:chromosomal replication initiation ATPase DnaA
MTDEIIAAVAGRYETAVEEIMAGRQREARNAAIYLLKRHTGMTNRAIGEQCGRVTYSAVTKACGKLEGEMEKNRRLRTLVRGIERELSRFKG